MRSGGEQRGNVHDRRARKAWLPIPLFPQYEVSNRGEIRRMITRRPLKLREREGTHYLYFMPQRGVKLYAHRAVLEAFVGPCPPGQQSRHLDGDPRNNTTSNLRWGTPSENADDKRRHGTLPLGERSVSSKLTSAEVRAIRRRRPSETLRALGAEYGVSHTAIRRAALGINWGHLNG